MENNNEASKHQGLIDFISEDEARGLKRLEESLGWVEWFKEYPGNCVRSSCYYTPEWQEAFDKYKKEIYEMFMMKHGDMDVYVLGIRLAQGWYERDLIKIVEFLSK